MPVFRNIHRSYFFIYFSVLGLYLFSLQNNFSASHDAITYLNHITKGENLFHPHHLLYNAIVNVWLNVWHFIFPSSSAALHHRVIFCSLRERDRIDFLHIFYKEILPEL